jgi:phosphoserine phosphatase RsbU/P
MKVLIAEDDMVSRRLLESTLAKWGYEAVTAEDGAQAWELLSRPNSPRLAILDWMMPGLDGPEVCRRLRLTPHGAHSYVLLLTARTERHDAVVGLEAGADDFITKPFDRDELRARLNVGRRIVQLQERLEVRVLDLERALAEVRQLRGLLPICAYCKRVREGDEYRQSLEQYFARHTDAKFSHGVCPECFEKYVRPGLAEL